MKVAIIFCIRQRLAFVGVIYVVLLFLKHILPSSVPSSMAIIQGNDMRPSEKISVVGVTTAEAITATR